jgi:hypothetical protein
MHSFPARLAAGAITAAAGAGLSIQFAVTYERIGAFLFAVWALLRFFTILANLLVLFVFGRVAARQPVAPSLLAGTTLAIVLVGVIYAALLQGLVPLSGGAKLADILLHYVTPWASLLAWLAYARKGALLYRDTLRWAIFPAFYLPYALVRGAHEGHYAYPFIDLGRLGATAVAANCAAIASGFLMAAAGLVWLDGQLGRKRR